MHGTLFEPTKGASANAIYIKLSVVPGLFVVLVLKPLDKKSISLLPLASAALLDGTKNLAVGLPLFLLLS